MTAPMSQDLRERIAHAVEAGSSARAAAERFAVSPSAAIKLMQRVRQTGSTAPAKIGGHRRPILEPHADTLRAIATSKPGITLKEMRDALHTRGIAVKALSTIADMLHRLGLSHKKRASERPSKTVPMWPDTAAAGGYGSAIWMPTVLCSWTKQVQRRA
jgi:putative transposase